MQHSMTISFKNIIRRVVLIVLGIVLGVSVYNMNASAVGKNDMPMPFGVGCAVVQSGSMEPALSIGDLLFVTQQGDYSVGDVVVYQSENILVVHRIVSISNDTVITKGDANNAADAPFSAQNIKGKVVVSIPVLGYLVDFVKTPLGILLLLIAAIALVELSFRRDVSHAKHDPRTIAINKLEREIENLRNQQ